MAIQQVAVSVRDTVTGLTTQGTVSAEILASGGTPQFPSLLVPYGNRRPTWQVAGVDYYVGLPSGPLKNPATFSPLPAFCTRDASLKQFYINGAAVVEGFDFSGWDVLVYGGVKPIVRRNNFVKGFLTWRADGTAVGGEIAENLFDQQNANHNRCLPIIFRPGDYLIELNEFRNSRHMHMQLTNGGPGASYIFRKNLGVNAGTGAPQGAHGDWLQMFGGYTVNDIQVDENTFVQDNATAATQGVSLNAATPRIRKGSYSRNVEIIKSNTNYGIIVLRRYIDGPFLINDNYVAPHWAQFQFSSHEWNGPPEPPYPSNWNTITKARNRNMLNGLIIS